MLQIAAARVGEAREVLERHGLCDCTQDLGQPAAGRARLTPRHFGRLRPDSVAANGSVVFRSAWIPLQRRWSEVSFRMQQLRDNPECAARGIRAAAG